MVYMLPPIGYRTPKQAYSMFGYAAAKYLPAIFGKNRAVLPAAQSLPVILSPFNGQFEAQGVAFKVTAQVPAGSTPVLTFGTQAPVTMSVVGTTATTNVTPGAGDVGIGTSLVVSIPTGSASIVLDVEANVAFWYDAQNPASYTNAGTALTGIKSLVSGSLLNAVTGAPTIDVDPRDGRLGFSFHNNSDYIEGVDSTYIAAANGTDKPFTSVTVIAPSLPTGSQFYDSVASSLDTNTSASFAINAGFAAVRSGTTAFKNAASQGTEVGLSVVVHHSSDGLTIKTRVNSEPETSVTITTAGSMTGNKVGIAVSANSAPAFIYSGYIRERVYFSSDKTLAQINAIIASMLKKWKPPPVLQFIGDSITTAQLATNGGFYALLTQIMVAAGYSCDPEGPIGSAIAPYRYSAVSGDTPTAMNTRVTDNTTGLGKGGGNAGYYQRTALACLFAGSNTEGSAAATAASYTTLLNNIATRLTQGQGSNWRIAVTTITDQNGNSAYVAAYNALLPAIWNAFDLANPGNKLIRWDAFTALPFNVSNYVDTTHPNNSGYSILVNDPTNGLLQAVRPYLVSIQPS